MSERAREIWNAPDPTDEAVWLVCKYARCHGPRSEGCRKCPRSRPDKNYGALTDGCRLHAEETFAAAYIGMKDAGYKIEIPMGTLTRADRVRSEPDTSVKL